MHWIGIQLIPSSLGLKVQKARFSYAKKTPILEELKEEDPSIFTKPNENVFVASALEASDVLFRQLILPGYERKKIISLLPFQIEPLLPYPLEEAIISTHITPNSDKKESTVQFFLTKKEHILSHLQSHEELGIAVDELFCLPSALAHFFSFFCEEQEKALIIHLNAQSILTVCVEKGSILSSHTFSIPTQEDPKKLQQEWDRIFSILQTKEDLPQKVLLTGDTAFMMAYITEAIPSHMKLLSVPSYGSYTAETMQSFAAPIGLALEAIKQKKIPSFSFYSSSLLSPFMQRKRKKQLLTFSSRAFCLLSLFLVLGNLYLTQKKSSLAKQFSTFFLQDGKKISSIDEMEHEISKREIEEKKKQKGYALHPPFASIGQVLSYISSHPAFSQTEGLEILQMDYSLDSYPSVSTNQAPYIGKVQIKLFIEEAAKASLSYDKFCQENPFIHKEKKPLFEKEGSYYRLTFFLSPFTGDL